MNTSLEISFTEKLSDIVDWFTQKRKEPTATDSSDALYEEIDQLKKTLATARTKPTQAVRGRNESLEPVTEQQKIMDMAG
jgi:flagellar hook-basal body complex protein FliE